MKVQLTYAEMLLAAQAGAMRQIENLKDKRTPAYGISLDQHWQAHIEGVLGEMALAKFLNVFWKGKGKMREPDVGRVDVRTTTYANGCLVLHDEDEDDRMFYLLTGCNGSYVVRGRMWAREGKKDRFWKDPTGKNRPAYFVDQKFLQAVKREQS